MRTGSAAKTVAGVLAVAGMLALSSPGVRVARAGDGEAASSEVSPAGVSSGSASGACRGGGENRASRSGVSTKIAERLQAEMRSSGEMPVVLNGRGYNYRISRDPQRELRIVESEATRQQEEAQAGR